MSEQKSTTNLEEKTAAPVSYTFKKGDYVTVLRKNWGTASIPPNKIDYITLGAGKGMQFKGGVAKNVRYEDAKKLEEESIGTGIYILPNDATDADYIRITGHEPYSMSELAAMLKAANLQDLLHHLKPEESARIVDALLQSGVQRGAA